MPERLRTLWAELDEHAEGHLRAAGFARGALRSRYQLNLRYPGQNWSLTVVAAEGKGARDLSFVDEGFTARMADRFHELHRAEYGHARLAETPEVTGVRLSTSVKTPRPGFRRGLEAPPREPAPAGTRHANLGRGLEKTAIHRGPDLRPGDRIASPAIVEETFTTIVVYPGWRARVDDAGDYQLERLD
jgi:N-methylhydantoinase A